AHDAQLLPEVRSHRLAQGLLRGRLERVERTTERRVEIFPAKQKHGQIRLMLEQSSAGASLLDDGIVRPMVDRGLKALQQRLERQVRIERIARVGMKDRDAQ